MNGDRQLVLTLPQRQAQGRDDFLVSDCNSEAIGWIDRWPDWPLPGLVVCGPPGAGKTHLGAVWRAQSGALEIKAESTAGALEAVLGDESLSACFVDDADRADQEGLFHLFNCVAARGGALLIACAEPPARWKRGLPDLISRLKTLPVAEITMPDDDMLRGVLIKMFADRQVQVSPEVLSYISVRMDRSFDAARHIVDRLDAQALSRHRAITIPFVRDVFPEWS